MEFPLFFSGKFRFGKRDGQGVVKNKDGTFERNNLRDINPYWTEKPPLEIKESFEDFNDESYVCFQPKSLLQIAIDALAMVMINRRDLMPANKIARVVHAKLKPMIALRYLQSRGGPFSSSGFIKSSTAGAFMPIERLKVSDAKLSVNDTEALIYFQCANRNLQSIELRANKLEALSIYTIVNEIVGNSWPYLVCIDLSFNKLDNISIENIVRGIKNMSCLQTLKLSSCKLDPTGAKLIASLLETDRQITDLDLSFNAILYAGAEKIASAIAVKTTLTSLNLRQNGLGSIGGEFIAQAMQFNFHIRILCLVDNKIGPDIMSLVSGRIRGGMTDTMISFRSTEKELSIPSIFKEGRFDKRKSLH